MNVNLYTIIVSYNGAKWIETCLGSLFASQIETNVVVVDNASSDNTVSLIKENYPSVVLLPQPQNLGFGKANNIGISYALKKDADFVFLLNQDARIEKNTLPQLIESSKKRPEYGILSPIQCNWEGNQLEYYFSNFMSANPAFYSHAVLKQEIKTIYEVPFVNAASWLIPRIFLEKIGGFDPIFKHYGEDNNYCQRIAYHNFKIGVVSNTYIYHDSKLRKEPENYLFSDTYWHNEIKQLQIKYGDITKPYSASDFRSAKNHALNLVILSLFRFRFKKVIGYLKKYSVIKDAFINIVESRNKNIEIGPHYLDI